MGPIPRLADLGRQACRMAVLARWLGPWANSDHRPAAVQRRTLTVPAPGRDEGFPAWLYVPVGHGVTGSYLLAPGLHFAGPAYPPMDRFCRILAAAGMMVLAPFLPDYIAQTLSPAAIRDFECCFETLLRTPGRPRDRRPWIFSVSFGSLVALRLAATPTRADQVGGLVLFGGYADWDRTIDFCLRGDAGPNPHDPLNRPVVFMNLLDDILADSEHAPADVPALMAAWRRYIQQTWGREELKRERRFATVARQVAADVADDARQLFLIGCGVLPGGYEMCMRALARRRTDFLDVRPHLAGLRCPVTIVHGLDDDVIPSEQARELAAALPASVPCEVHMTGLYGHTRPENPLSNLSAIAGEAAALVRIVAAVARAAAPDSPT